MTNNCSNIPFYATVTFTYVLDYWKGISRQKILHLCSFRHLAVESLFIVRKILHIVANTDVGKNDNSLEDLLICSAPFSSWFSLYMENVFFIFSHTKPLCAGRGVPSQLHVVGNPTSTAMCPPPAFLSLAKSFVVSNNLPLCVADVHIYPYIQLLHKSAFISAYLKLV